MSIVTLESNFLTVKIKTFGAEITSVLDSDNKEYMWQGNPEIWPNQAPVCFPIASRLRIHAPNKYTLNGKEYEMGLHGFAKISEFEIEKQSENSVTLLLRANEKTRAQYPFEFEFRAVYTLIDRALKVDFITTNLSESDMYYSTGSHEAYNINGGVENYSIVFDEPETLSRYFCVPEGGVGETPIPFLKNEREFKLSEEYFTIDGIIFFDAKSRGVALRDDRTNEIIHVTYPNCETLTIWKKPNAAYVCIEPWAGASDLEWKPYKDFSEKYRIRTLGVGKTECITHTIEF